MEIIKLSFEYEVKGISRVMEFSPVSYSTLKTKELTFGVPQRIKRIFERKSFRMIEVHSKPYDGRILKYSGHGYSVNGHNLFFHFRCFHSEDNGGFQ